MLRSQLSRLVTLHLQIVADCAVRRTNPLAALGGKISECCRESEIEMPIRTRF